TLSLGGNLNVSSAVESQLVTFGSGVAAGNRFRLSLAGITTAEITYTSANIGTSIQTALNNLFVPGSATQYFTATRLDAFNVLITASKANNAFINLPQIS